MRKLDKSIRNITLAAIKRSLMPDAVCRLTHTYKDETMADISLTEVAEAGELPIACTYVDKDNYTLITTRRMISIKDGYRYAVPVSNIKTYNPGDFKGVRDNLVTIGCLKTIHDESIPFLIETGKPSMIFVKAIGTVMGLNADGGI